MTDKINIIKRRTDCTADNEFIIRIQILLTIVEIRGPPAFCLGPTSIQRVMRVLVLQVKETVVSVRNKSSL